MSAKVLPKPIRFTTRGFVYRRFSWRERIKLALGYSVLLEIHIASEHNPGQTQPLTKFHFTEHVNEADALIQVRRQVEADQKARGVEANKLPDKK